MDKLLRMADGQSFWAEVNRHASGPAWISGSGKLRSATIRLPSGEETRHGPCLLVGLSGAVFAEPPMAPTVLLVTDAGSTSAGELVDFVADQACVLLSPAALATSRGVSVPSAPSRALAEVAPAVVSSGAVGWADVARASAEEPTYTEAAVPSPQPPSLADKMKRAKAKKRVRRKQIESKVPLFQPEPLPGRPKKEPTRTGPQPEEGDFVLHPVFGRCEVVSEDEAQGIKIRTVEGRLKSIRLTVFDVGEGDIEGNEVVYRLRPRRPTD